MKLDKKQTDLLEFVKLKHGNQVRKYTGEPYWTHPLAVAELAYRYCPAHLVIEISLCHDLFEDTDCDFDSLYKKLIEIGYNAGEAYGICTSTKELTDKFTKEDFPHLNREKRKQLEANRLGTTGWFTQSIKCADLIENSKSILENDPKFAVIYLIEKNWTVQKLVNAQPDLLKLAQQI